MATAATTNPPAPTTAPGATFSVTDTVQNSADWRPRPRRRATTSRSMGEECGRHAPDRNPAVPALAAGGSHSGTVTVTIPSTTPLNTYSLLACADDLNAVAETNEGNNCTASRATVTVTP